MKNKIIIILLSIISVFTSCSSENENPLLWLQGTWRETSQKGIPVFHESWEKQNNRLHGFGFEVLNSDTTYMEELYLEKVKDVWCYRALVPAEHGSDTVDFKLKTDPYGDSLVFENLDNDFPAIITYKKRSANKMEVTLEPNPKLTNNEEEIYILFFEKAN